MARWSRTPSCSCSAGRDRPSRQGSALRGARRLAAAARAGGLLHASLSLLAKRRCFAVLDTYGEPLRLGVRGKPYLVTPNIREAEDLVGHEFNSEEDIVEATAAHLRPGATERHHQVARRLLRAHPPRPQLTTSTRPPCRSSAMSSDRRLRRCLPGRLHRLSLPARGCGRLPALGPGLRRRQHAALRRRRVRPRPRWSASSRPPPSSSWPPNCPNRPAGPAGSRRPRSERLRLASLQLR